MSNPGVAASQLWKMLTAESQSIEPYAYVVVVVARPRGAEAVASVTEMP